MIIVYTPAEGEAERYDASSLRVSEASIVQRTIDMKWQEILRGLEDDDLDAMRGIVWVLKKRSQPSLRFGDFDPGVGEMTTLMDDREVDAYIDNAFRAAETDTDLSAQDVADILSSRLPDASADPDRTRARIAERASAPKAQPEEEPTAAEPAEDRSPSPTSSTPELSTSGSSPTSSTSPRPPSTS